MPSSVVFWSVAAVLAFWAIGAYNRLMRLRADANTAFAGLGTELDRQIEWVRSQVPALEAAQPAAPDAGGVFWSTLQGAAGQLAASLAAARIRPLEPDRIAALSSAQHVLAMAWERPTGADAHDVAGASLPDSVLARRVQLEIQVQSATEQFNQAVARYNEGIGQFPALLLAWLFGFKPGRGIPQLGAAVAR